MSQSGHASTIAVPPERNLLKIFLIALKLGLTSFGGPVAHLGYFHEEYVRRRKWIDERSYADLVALCQFLPGPASSQVGIGIGVLRGGLLGGIAAWLGFTLPSAAALALFAMAMQGSGIPSAGWLHGLKLVAVAIVAHAIWSMGTKLAPDRWRATIAVAAAAAVLLWQTALAQVLVIAAAGCAGIWLYKHKDMPKPEHIHVPISRRTAMICLSLFVVLLAALPLLRQAGIGGWFMALFDSMYRAGSLVFGGGHVVLPLLEREFVPTGWLDKADFFAGYGATQAVPGPLFTFAAYIGAAAHGWLGAIVATIAIFLPAFLLIVGALPFWSALRVNSRAQGALFGVNAAVVGILIAALYTPLWTSTVQAPADFALAAALFVLLTHWRTPPWAVVIVGVLGGTLLEWM
ncbi:chromate efflux transporter [Paenibacillus agilis]|uniref:Chromate efflux transporter n=1 Tax=Paenibacillus agilis TaxID=3020863 RepID=A0A559IKS9_9BACL|nr:chromate efflux transporter [Paenibacillus agilis]TVX88259.1 chromate efflux transporter [Paenibacillus agilis]